MDTAELAAMKAPKKKWIDVHARKMRTMSTLLKVIINYK